MATLKTGNIVFDEPEELKKFTDKVQKDMDRNLFPELFPEEVEQVEYENLVIGTPGEETKVSRERFLFPIEKIESRIKEIESEKRISKNCFKGDQIKTAARIKELANLGRAVYHIHWGIRPAAVIINMSLDMIITAIWKNQFFEVINTTKDEDGRDNS